MCAVDRVKVSVNSTHSETQMKSRDSLEKISWNNAGRKIFKNSRYHPGERLDVNYSKIVTLNCVITNSLAHSINCLISYRTPMPLLGPES